MAFSTTISARAAAQGEKFPYVTIPMFEVLGEGYRIQSGAEGVVYSNIVHPHEVDEYIEYTQSHQNWTFDSRAMVIATEQAQSEANLDGESTHHYVPTLASNRFSDVPALPILWETPKDVPGFLSAVAAGSLDGVELELSTTVYPDGPFYFPLWQTSPPAFSNVAMGFNMIGFFPGSDELLYAGALAREGVFREMIETPVLLSVGIQPEEHLAYHNRLVQRNQANVTAEDLPHFGFVYPIFEQAYNVSSRVVGTLLAILPWDRYMINLLPEGVVSMLFCCTNKIEYQKAHDIVLLSFSSVWSNVGYQKLLRPRNHLRIRRQHGTFRLA
jgi:hypothetical protein